MTPRILRIFNIRFWHHWWSLVYTINPHYGLFELLKNRLKESSSESRKFQMRNEIWMNLLEMSIVAIENVLQMIVVEMIVDFSCTEVHLDLSFSLRAALSGECYFIENQHLTQHLLHWCKPCILSENRKSNTKEDKDACIIHITVGENSHI